MSLGQSKKPVKTMTEIEQAIGISDSSLVRWCEELLFGTRYITTELQVDLLLEFAKIKKSKGLSPKKALVELEAIRGKDLKIARGLKPDDESDNSSPGIEEIAANLRTISQQIMALGEKIDSLVSNPGVRLALSPSLRNNYKIEFGRKIVSLHGRLRMPIAREAVYKGVNLMLSKFGIACTGVAISDVIDMADTGTLSVTKDTCLGIIYKIAERHSDEGNYNDDDYIAFMEMSPVEQVVDDIPDDAKAKVKYINSLLSPYTNRRYYNLTVREYCLILMGHIADNHELYVDPMGLYGELEVMSTASDALNEITCQLDTPNIDINSARRIKCD